MDEREREKRISSPAPSSNTEAAASQPGTAAHGLARPSDAPPWRESEAVGGSNVARSWEDDKHSKGFVDAID